MEEGLGKFVNEGERETCAEEPVEKWDMEKGLREIAETFENLFALPHVDIKTYSPLTLAYMGKLYVTLFWQKNGQKRYRVGLQKGHRI